MSWRRAWPRQDFLFDLFDACSSWVPALAAILQSDNVGARP
jgi:hypothetical protein